MTNQSPPDEQEKNGTPPLSGVDLILKERGSTYGDSGVNLACMAAMWEAFCTGRIESPANREFNKIDYPNFAAHEMAIVMILGKIARIATGKAHADNYDDLIGYAKIAKQHAIKKVEENGTAESAS